MVIGKFVFSCKVGRLVMFICYILWWLLPAVANVDEGHDDEEGEGDGEEEEQHRGDHLGEGAHLLNRDTGLKNS